MRRAFDHAVGEHHVDEGVPLRIAAAHDLHLLEEQRAAQAEDVLTLLELLLDADRPDLESPSQPDQPPFSGTVKWQATPSTSGSSRP